MALQKEESKKVRGLLQNLLLGRRLKRDRFRPFGGTINDHEHVGETIGLRERTNQVNMNVRTSVLEQGYDELELSHDSEPYSPSSLDKTEPRG